MYHGYFNLRESPFNLTPDPRFFFGNGPVQDALEALCQGIEQRKGFIVITGEAGTGKTTLLKRFIQSAAARVYTLGILDPHLTFVELLQCAFGTYGLPPCANDQVTMARQLERYLVEQLERDRVVTMLIDEAQDLDDALLERLGMLTDMERDGARLLQLVLVGQPSLDERLAMPLFNQLQQCVTLRSQLRPLTDGEIRGYVDHRLMAAGYSGEPIFSAPAIERIAAFSRGVPRLINVICDNALLTACAMAQPWVGAAFIDDVADELHLGPLPTSAARWTLPAQQIPEAWGAAKPVGDYGVADIDALPGRRAGKYLPDSVAPMAVRSARPDDSPSGDVHWPGLLLGFAALTLVVAAVVTVQPGKSSFQPVRANITRVIEAVTPLPGQFYRLLMTRGESADGNVTLSTHRQLAEVRPVWRAPDQPKAAVLDNQTTDVDGTHHSAVKTSPRPQPVAPPTAAPHAPGERASANVTRTRPVEFVVVDNSFVRTQPAAEAEIIMALRPGTHIQLVNRRGDYLLVRAPKSGLNQGFVHKEDAFFEPVN
ncbi:MAG TPA: AAA family ATPase [Candidatus Binatia bacterium]